MVSPSGNQLVPQPEPLVVNSQNEILSGSLDALIDALLRDNKYNDFEDVLLLLHKQFTTTEVLFTKLLERYQVPRLANQSRGQHLLAAIPVQVKVWSLVKRWLTDYPEDLTETPDLLRQFILLLREDNHTSLAECLETILPQQLLNPVGWLNHKEKEIAEQLTLIEFEMFSKISQREFVAFSWSKQNKEQTSPHLSKMIARFNRFAKWVSFSIVNEEKLTDRVKVFSKFIEIGEWCHKLHNYNTLMAIIAGLTHTAVHRLKDTKANLPTQHVQTLESLTTLMSSTKSYQAYRQDQRACSAPSLPYIGVNLTDLTFMEEGNPDRVGTSSINFRKFKVIQEVIATITALQNTPYEITPEEPLFHFLQSVASPLDEEGLYNLSLEREPRQVPMTVECTSTVSFP